MQAYRPDRVVRVLTTLVSIAYFGMWAGATVVLIGAPAVRLLAAGNLEWEWGLRVPARVVDAEAAVTTRWGAARLEVEDARGVLRLPIAMLPWWFVAMLWAHFAAAAALMLLFLHHLRRICHRVRDGAPFDADNALRIRWLGVLLLAFAILNGVAELVTSVAVRRGLASGTIAIPSGLHVDGSAVFVALVLVALAEIFRRGAALEDEQSLVV